MTAGHQLIYDFLNLPHHVQMQIGSELSLEQRQESETDTDMFVRWFRVIREREGFDKLRRAVTDKMSSVVR